MAHERNDRENNQSNNWSLIRIAANATVAVSVLVTAYVAYRNPKYVQSAWHVIHASNHTGTISAAVLGPSTAFGLGYWFTMPRQQQQEADRLRMQRQMEQERAAEQELRMEIDNAYGEGAVYLQGVQKEDIKPNYSRATEAFRKARRLLLQLYPDDQRDHYKERVRNCLYNEALSLFFLGEYVRADHLDAMTCLTELLKQNPNDREALNLRGLIYLNQEKYSNASIDFENSLRLQLSQNEIYICWLFAKNQLRESKGNLQEDLDTILERVQMPWQEKIIVYEIPYIYAKILLQYAQTISVIDAGHANKKREYLIKAMNSIEAGVDLMPKNPAFLDEKSKLTHLQLNIFTELKEVMTQTPIEVKPLNSKYTPYKLDRESLQRKITDVEWLNAGLKRQQMAVRELTNKNTVAPEMPRPN